MAAHIKCTSLWFNRCSFFFMANTNQTIRASLSFTEYKSSEFFSNALTSSLHDSHHLISPHLLLCIASLFSFPFRPPFSLCSPSFYPPRLFLTSPPSPLLYSDLYLTFSDAVFTEKNGNHNKNAAAGWRLSPFACTCHSCRSTTHTHASIIQLKLIGCALTERFFQQPDGVLQKCWERSFCVLY